MGDLNKVTMIGRIGKDAAIFGQGATKVLSFTVAANFGWGDKKGTMWYKVASFVGEKSLERAKKLSAMLVKGTEVFVTGDLSEETYNEKTQNVVTVSINDVVITKFKVPKDSTTADPTPTADVDDGIPF